MSGNGRKKGSALRGALIGFGSAALHAHLPCYERTERFSIEAVVEPDAGRAEQARRYLRSASIYDRLEPLLEEDRLDFVDICAPSHTHAELVERALGAGLHVLCEKPLVTSFESLKRIEAAHPAGCVLFTVNNWKHAPLWLSAEDIIRQEMHGGVRSVFLSVRRTPASGGGLTDWRRAGLGHGGILLDHGWHQLYLLHSIVNDLPVQVSAVMSFNGSTDEIADLTIRFSSVEARLHLSWRADARSNHGEIAGDHGRILINDDHLIFLPRNNGGMRHDFDEALSGGSHHPRWMERVFDDFYSEIIDEGVRGRNLDEARWCARLIDLAYKSGREGSHCIRVDDGAP